MNKYILRQRIKTQQELREIFNAMGIGEALYRLIEIFREVDENN